MAGGRTRRNQLAAAAREGEHSDGVVLAEHEIGERGRELPRIVQLRKSVRGVAHRGACVDEQRRAEVRLLLVLLQVFAIRFREHLPVQVAERIAGHVLAVLGELDAEAVVRTLVESGQKAIHDETRAEIETRELRYEVRVEEALRGLGHGRYLTRSACRRRW